MLAAHLYTSETHNKAKSSELPISTRLSSLQYHAHEFLKWYRTGSLLAADPLPVSLSDDQQLQNVNAATITVLEELLSILKPVPTDEEPLGYAMHGMITEVESQEKKTHTAIITAYEVAEEVQPITLTVFAETQPKITSTEHASSYTTLRTPDAVANDILDLLEQYSQHLKTEADGIAPDVWLGKPMFKPGVLKQVKSNLPIRMILPSFPWKSINRIDKVNGPLPDLGEELALSKLHALCEDIREVYEPGGEVTIATDGLIFDDVVGITDKDTWDYGEELLSLCVRKGFNSLKLLRAIEILGLNEGKALTFGSYLALADTARKAVVSEHGRSEEDIRALILNDSDSMLTYRGFIRFLETDLRHSPVAAQAKSGQQFRKIVKKVAMQMMIRAESFTGLLKAKCKGYVRLSIHPSSGTVKLSIPLIPQPNGDFPKSPWHCTIAVGLDGSYRTAHAKDVRESHKLVYRHGRPYYYRERSELWDWNVGDVVFEPLYPSGLLVRPDNADGRRALTTEELGRLRQLAQIHRGPLKVEGFLNGLTGLGSSNQVTVATAIATVVKAAAVEGISNPVAKIDL